MPKTQSNRGQRKLRVVLADDHPIVREGLAQLINQQGDLECTGEAATQAEVLAELARQPVDLLLLDLRLKDGDGLEFIKTLQSLHPKLPVLVISQFDEELYAERALRSGARGYVMKEQASKEVLEAIRTVLAGGLYVTHAMNTRLLQKAIGMKTQREGATPEILSDREFQVLQFLGSGLSTREIAARMGLSIKTVETYREHLKHKLGLRNADELVSFARNQMSGNAGNPGPTRPPTEP